MPRSANGDGLVLLFASYDRLLAHADEPLPSNEPSALEQDLVDSSVKQDDKGKEVLDDNGQEEKPVTKTCLKCNECSKSFASTDLVQLHAARTGHADFSEAVDERSLSPEDKAAHLLQLQERLKEKRAAEAAKADEDAKRNELARRKTGRELAEAREKVRDAEVQKALEERKRARADEKATRARILAQIDDDRRAKREKVQHTGIYPYEG